jgi:hypothetical protein
MRRRLGSLHLRGLGAERGKLDGIAWGERGLGLRNAEDTVEAVASGLTVVRAMGC